jgi:hypothetical protein
MAKELPYFKFEPNEWENGNIQMLSREDKGLFIDLCCMYWSRLGDLPYRLAIQKVCGGNANALNPLFEDDIISVDENDIIVISFLQEQLSEFSNISNQNSKNAKDGWEKRRKQKELSERNANAYDSQSESDAIREDKRREDEIKEKNNNKFDFKKSLLSFGFDSILVDEWLKVRRVKKAVNSEIAFNGFIREVNLNGQDINFILQKCVENSWKGFESKWLLNETISQNNQSVIIETEEQMLKRRFAKS